MAAGRTARGVSRVILPHYNLADLRAMLAFECPGAQEDLAAFGNLPARCQAYFNGQAVGFDEFDCDIPSETTWAGKVLRICRAIPHGQTRSYTQVALLAGNADGARAAAGALAKNPVPLVIPCHRVTYAGGKLGGFSAPGGEDLKRRMLKLEKAL
jgi:methylated-DNA-[protein]-cysteine S-methyltransferase